jgi:hypothetical protein
VGGAPPSEARSGVGGAVEVGEELAAGEAEQEGLVRGGEACDALGAQDVCAEPPDLVVGQRAVERHQPRHGRRGLEGEDAEAVLSGAAGEPGAQAGEP